ncbi:MAG TPA: hypothetical protein VFY68_16825, partial [Nitrososphaeraceae archaeon]|nr:hypothetical protein [Nitrososphaeraceae archaeon]
MSVEGLSVLKRYFSAKDQEVFEPLFIAQYLFVPVNTIVKNSLLPWMMEKLGYSSIKYLKDKDQAKKNKAEVFLKYNVMVELMNIVKVYGRNDGYNFETDNKLLCIRNGNYSDQRNFDRTKNTLAINSFMTIWLLTLPEKFQEWFEKRNS